MDLSPEEIHMGDDIEFDDNNGHSGGQVNVIEMLPNYVIDLLEMMEHDQSKINELQGEQVHITTVDRDEDVLVYLCSIAERLMF